MSHHPRDLDDQRPPRPSTQPFRSILRSTLGATPCVSPAAEAVDACLGTRRTAAHAAAADALLNGPRKRLTCRELAWR